MKAPDGEKGRGGANRRTVVVVTDRRLLPAREGSQARIVALLAALRAEGFTVVLVIRRVPGRLGGRLPALRPILTTGRLADRIVWVKGDYFHAGSPSDFSVRPYADALKQVVARYRPVAVIAQYLWMAPVLDVLPEEVQKLVDTHDVMHLRREIYADQPEGTWVECGRDEEAKLLSHADVVMAIQPREAEIFRDMLPDRRIICVPHGIEVPGPGTLLPEGPNVVFVGSRIQGNVVGMRNFIEHAWPVVISSRPDAVLRVYGDVVTRLEADDPSIDLIGFVEDLEEAYAGATVIINPVALGTGLKIKTIEALARGRPVVTTSCGAEGLPDRSGFAFVVEDEMGRFGAAVVALLNDGNRRREMAAAAAELAREYYSPAAAVRELVEEIGRKEPAGSRSQQTRKEPVGGLPGEADSD